MGFLCFTSRIVFVFALHQLKLFHFKGSTLQDISRLKNTSKLIIGFNEFTSLNNIYDLVRN